MWIGRRALATILTQFGVLHREITGIRTQLRNTTERIMSQFDDLKAAYAELHQTIVDDIAEENALLQKLADANAAGDATGVADLIKQAASDNADLQASITKSKAAVGAITPPPV
jgi:predicted nuclease with TOPRIM domain